MKSNSGRRNKCGIDIKTLIDALNTNPTKRRKSMWLSKMFPDLDKYQLSAKARELKRLGWSVAKRWDPERERTYSWAEPPEGKHEKPEGAVLETDEQVIERVVEKVIVGAAKEAPTEIPPTIIERGDVVDSSALENALSAFFNELMNLRVEGRDKDRKIAGLEKANQALTKDNLILKDENSKLRSYGLTTVGITPTMRKILDEFKKA